MQPCITIIAKSINFACLLLYSNAAVQNEEAINEWDPCQMIKPASRQATFACRSDWQQRLGPAHVGAQRSLFFFLNLARVLHGPLKKIKKNI